MDSYILPADKKTSLYMFNYHQLVSKLELLIVINSKYCTTATYDQIYGSHYTK